MIISSGICGKTSRTLSTMPRISGVLSTGGEVFLNRNPAAFLLNMGDDEGGGTEEEAEVW